jgi:hypothetical protein
MSQPRVRPGTSQGSHMAQGLQDLRFECNVACCALQHDSVRARHVPVEFCKHTVCIGGLLPTCVLGTVEPGLSLLSV